MLESCGEDLSDVYVIPYVWVWRVSAPKIGKGTWWALFWHPLTLMRLQCLHLSRSRLYPRAGPVIFIITKEDTLLNEGARRGLRVGTRAAGRSSTVDGERRGREPTKPPACWLTCSYQVLIGISVCWGHL